MHLLFKRMPVNDGATIHSEDCFLLLSKAMMQALYSNSNAELFITEAIQYLRKMTGNSLLDKFVNLLSQVTGVAISCQFVIPELVSCLKCSSSETKHICQALTSLLAELPQDAVGIVIVRPLMKSIIPWSLESLAGNDDETAMVLVELLRLLRACITGLDSKSTAKYISDPHTNLLQKLLLSCLEMSRQSSGSIHNALLHESSECFCAVLRRGGRQCMESLYRVIEQYCSRINDLYCRFALGKERVEDVAGLVGVKEAREISKAAASIAGMEAVAANCASVKEFFSWSEDVIIDGRTSAADISIERTASDPCEGEGLVLELRPPAPQASSRDSTEHDNLSRGPSSSSHFSTWSETELYRHSKQKRDLAWVLPVGLNKEQESDKIHYLWQPRMMLATTLEYDEADASNEAEVEKFAITCLATNLSESTLAVGTSQGCVLIFDLKAHPPHLELRKEVEPNCPLLSIAFLRNNLLLVCNGDLHLFDTTQGATINSLTKRIVHPKRAAESVVRSFDDFITFDLFPMGTGHEEILGESEYEAVSITKKDVYMIHIGKKLNQRSSGAIPLKSDKGAVRELFWDTALPRDYRGDYFDEGEATGNFEFTFIAAESGWVSVGCRSGHIHCFKRRGGELLACWKGHDKSIEHLKAISNQRLLSVGADKSAVLWSLAQNPPTKLSCIQTIPGREGSMNIVCRRLRPNGLVSVPGDDSSDVILFAATGRKAVFMNLPQGDGPLVEKKARRIVMSDYQANVIPSAEKLKITSATMLTCRQLIVLGCADGQLHICI